MSNAFDWSRKKTHTTAVGWPQVTRGMPAVFEALTRTLEETQWQLTAEIRRHQHEQLRALARHFAEASPQFQERLQNAGLAANDLGTREGLQRLPVLTRRALQQTVSVPDDKLGPGHLPTQTLRTSGSTGEPVAVQRTALNMQFWRALSMRELIWHEKRFDVRLSSIRATNSEYAVWQDWGTPVNFLFRTGPAQIIPITADIAQQARWLAEFQPRVLLVYPNVLDALVRHCKKTGIQLSNLKLIRSVSETLSPRIRQEAEYFFGAKVVDNYSSQELGVIAIQCPDSDLYHVMDEAVIVEVLREDGSACAPGEVGRVVVTDLQGYATPLIRYDIGDYAEAAGPCPCGRGLHTLVRVVGRERNLIVMPDGTKHWPLVGFAKFREVAPVAQYQIIQEQDDALEVRLVTERPMTATEEDALAGVIRDALGYAFKIRFGYYKGMLPRSTSGKFEEFVCRVQS